MSRASAANDRESSESSTADAQPALRLLWLLTGNNLEYWARIQPHLDTKALAALRRTSKDSLRFIDAQLPTLIAELPISGDQAEQARPFPPVLPRGPFHTGELFLWVYHVLKVRARMPSALLFGRSA